MKNGEKCWREFLLYFTTLETYRGISCTKTGSGKGADQFLESILVSMYISSSKSLYLSKKCIVKKKIMLMLCQNELHPLICVLVSNPKITKHNLLFRDSERLIVEGGRAQ